MNHKLIAVTLWVKEMASEFSEPTYRNLVRLNGGWDCSTNRSPKGKRKTKTVNPEVVWRKNCILPWEAQIAWIISCVKEAYIWESADVVVLITDASGRTECHYIANRSKQSLDDLDSRICPTNWNVCQWRQKVERAISRQFYTEMEEQQVKLIEQTMWAERH